MIYLDSSALVKLVFEEAESEGVVQWLAERSGTPAISSELSVVELLQACRRVDELGLGDATRLLGSIDLLPLDRTVIERAGSLAPTHLRSLGAIHLASALSVNEDLTALVVYDRRLSAAAMAAGIEVASPT